MGLAGSEMISARGVWVSINSICCNGKATEQKEPGPLNDCLEQSHTINLVYNK